MRKESVSAVVAKPTVVGLSGGSSSTRPLPGASRHARIVPPTTTYHDSAAVLICDGQIIAGIEEERLNRVKHTNRIAAHATRRCLDIAGLSVRDVDRFAFYGKEEVWDRRVWHFMLSRHDITPRWRARDYLADALSHDLACDLDPSRVTFVEHHLAHATSAYLPGPFADALVVTLDGEGDGLSGSVWAGQGEQLTRLLDIPRSESLGLLYLRAIQYLGYQQFDEYKVMGLAPYGNPQRYRHLFEAMCQLRPNGRFEVQLEQVSRLSEVLTSPRRASEPMTDVHRDLAAALQESIERATLHLLDFYRNETGLRYLCLAGGVAHNSTMVGSIARSGLFDGVFAQPASHDAGCALGAALHVARELAPRSRSTPLVDVYWGTDIGDEPVVRATLERWDQLVEIRRMRDTSVEVAELIASGAVIGWVQGRSEFGPRALGNRSILADPRPAENKERINRLIKQREAYRPFAPAVLEEHANQLFDMPPGTLGAFMTFTVPVRAHSRHVLGAVTHVDGTARVQTVTRASNPRFWSLIDAFGARTGTPVLLNTSFNHSVEPIVDSIDDAVTCFLTTGLTHLVVQDYLVIKREVHADRLLRLSPSFPEHVQLVHARSMGEGDDIEDVRQCQDTIIPSHSQNISHETYQLLSRADGRSSLDDLVRHGDIRMSSVVLAELEDLWMRRLLRFLPPCASPGLASEARGGARSGDALTRRRPRATLHSG
jgi:carbamoyltransferase